MKNYPKHPEMKFHPSKTVRNAKDCTFYFEYQIELLCKTIIFHHADHHWNNFKIFNILPIKIRIENIIAGDDRMIS